MGGYSKVATQCITLPMSNIWKIPKLMDPIFMLAISGLVRTAARRRSSRVMPKPPPVEMFITASVDCLIRGRNSMNKSGFGSGFLFSGSRACRWIMDAPASAASILAVAISLGVMGRCSDIVGE